jgi:GMP synthase (glutamine-hydrolysing)
VRRLLVFQHVSFEPLGTLHPLLKRYGFRIRYVNFGREPDAQPNVAAYDGVIVLGGPMSAWDEAGHPHLRVEIAAIRAAIAAELPVLGICLGAQLTARALGAHVAPAAEKEIGWHDVERTAAGAADPMLGAFAPTERVFQWHGDAFEMPKGAELLATSAGCPHQAFRYGDRTYGLQFHLEVDGPLIERWLTVPEHRAEVEAEAEAGRVDPERIRFETPERLPRTSELSDRAFGSFLELFTRRRRRGSHPHR